MAPEKAPKQAKCEPDREAKDKSYLQAGSKIWVEYYDAGAELKWFKANVATVSPEREVLSTSVVRVHFFGWPKDKFSTWRVNPIQIN